MPLVHGPLDLVVLPFYDWKKCEAVGFRTRDGHILQELLKHDSVGRILVIGRPSSLPEMIATHRWWRARRGKIVSRGASTALVQVHAKGYSLDVFFWAAIRPLLMRQSWWDYSLRHRRTHAAARNALRTLGFEKPAVITCTPLSAGLLGALDPSAVVFSADDDWLHHPGIVRERVRARVAAGYDELCKVADRIVVNSRALQEVLKPRRPDAVYIPNGVSLEQFQGPLGPPPPDLAMLPKPWIGYAGTLARRIDVRLLLDVAQALAEATFVLLGPIDDKAWIRPLMRAPNIHWLGNKPYSLLPPYVRHFDIAIIPHNVGSLENRGDPIKLYEYLAAGRPVVTTPIAELDEFASQIAIASGPSAFAAAIKRYLDLPDHDRRALCTSLPGSIPDSRTWRSAAARILQVTIDAQRSPRVPL